MCAGREDNLLPQPGIESEPAQESKLRRAMRKELAARRMLTSALRACRSRQPQLPP